MTASSLLPSSPITVPDQPVPVPSANQTEKPQVAETQDNKVAGQKEEALAGTTKVAALHSESPQDQPQKAQTVKVEKQTKVTLSGLLNAIDGPGSKEGRLLIMTTNAPDVLDKALYRRGRIDRKFHLSYSTKQSAALTFMRIFGRDPLNEVPEKKLTSMSKRFANKIPKGVFTPSDIQEFCLTYRGRPQDAVDSIAQFVEDKLSGKHGFEYDITRLNKEPSMVQKLETEDEDDMLSEDEYEEDSESSRPSLGRTDSGSSSSTSSGQLTPASSQFRLFDTERKLKELLAPSPPASDDASPASSRWNLNPLSLIGSVFKYGRKQPKQMDVTDLLLPAIMMNCEGQISPYVQRELLPGTRSPSIWSLSSRQSTPPLSSLSSEESTPPLSSLSSEERISEVEAAVRDDNEANGDVEDDIEGTLSEASDDTFFYSSCSSEGQIEDTFQRFRTPSHEDVAGSLNQYPYHGALDGEEEDGHTMLLRSMPPTPIDETEVLDLENGNGGEAGTVQMEQDDEVEDLDEQVEETAVAAADK
jgi:mitochondrial chaperone BCS1